MVCYKVLTLFPNLINEYINSNAPLKRGIEKGIIKIKVINFREYSDDKHKKVDDEIYGDGAGMLLKCQPIIDAVRGNSGPETKIIITDPRGKVFNNKIAKELSKEKEIMIICGRYEGFDERINMILKPERISLGDFILTNGEIVALSIIDSSIRFIEGVLDSYESTFEESFNPLLEYDQYTRPREYKGLKVPEALISGDHKKIKEFRLKSALKNTIKNRPDLLKSLNLDISNLKIAKEIIKEIYHDK
ncbi:MAG TPA: tRNA (guanosine(37)-N1)-methyltransferase TrmD [Spirochaetota bacterium]|nr:tRNA (guanosine(37)-N1)-methyltransferase TrmD [Spirochaetota bacterium]HOM37894.1 tRNA (guanosine(37)-N1)-methyltransferase TrmD [Spirochaetota bacterium]HPQ48698.1 tRNA (guanosine(37)-N1)-methyltransferase TrmD [Spirochaetota bacterium]